MTQDEISTMIFVDASIQSKAVRLVYDSEDLRNLRNQISLMKKSPDALRKMKPCLEGRTSVDGSLLYQLMESVQFTHQLLLAEACSRYALQAAYKLNDCLREQFQDECTAVLSDRVRNALPVLVELNKVMNAYIVTALQRENLYFTPEFIHQSYDAPLRVNELFSQLDAICMDKTDNK